MGRPHKSVVYAANATALGDMAQPLRQAADKMLESTERVRNTVYDFEWEGEAKDAADGRADRELVQNRAVGAAKYALADAYDNGAKTMQPMIDSLKSKGQGLEADGFAVSEDWVVTDTYDYDTGRKLAPLFGMSTSDVDALQTRRTNEASTETTNLQRLADELGVADENTTKAINDAKAALADAAPASGRATPPPRAPVLPDDPEQFTQAWNDLSPEEKDAAYQQDHFIGNHPGMPWDPPDHLGRDHYNRMHLDEFQHDNQADIDRLRAQHPNWADGETPFLKGGDYALWKQQWDAANHTHDGYVQVQNALNSPDGLPRLLGIIDDKGHGAVSINNPDAAKRTATLVPGTGQDLTRFQGSADKSRAMLEATMNADRSLQRGDVSVTTWMGYDRPMNVFEAASTSYAHNGADALDNFQAGLRASHNDALAGGPSINTVIGHSYGTTLVGAAGLDGHLDANNVIAVASPGMLVDHASDLNLDPNANVYATRARFDPINAATGWTLGTNPTNDGFGATTFQAAPGPTTGPRILALPSIAAHSSYWDNMSNPALINMGRIIAGRTDVTPPTPGG